MPQEACHDRKDTTGFKCDASERSRVPTDKKQVFRLWKCAVKDDDKLVDAVIEKLYEEMIAFDLACAETVMQLIIDRDEAAVPTFRGLLQDISASNLPKTDQSRCHGASPTKHLQELGVPRELIRPNNKHKQNERPRRECLNLHWNILQRLDVPHVSRSNARVARPIRCFTKRHFPTSIAPALRVIRSAVGRVEIPSLAS